jgi:hypothetical protein
MSTTLTTSGIRELEDSILEDPKKVNSIVDIKTVSSSLTSFSNMISIIIIIYIDILKG